MFGLSFEKLIVVGVAAALLLGPERLPRYAAQLASAMRALRAVADSTTSRMKAELGPEFQDVEWSKLDPRQYDPRRIIRDALLDDGNARPTVTPATVDPSNGELQVVEIGGAAEPSGPRLLPAE